MIGKEYIEEHPGSIPSSISIPMILHARFRPLCCPCHFRKTWVGVLPASYGQRKRSRQFKLMKESDGTGPWIFLVSSMNPFWMLWLFSLAGIPLPLFPFSLHLFLDTELDMRPDHQGACRNQDRGPTGEGARGQNFPAANELSLQSGRLCIFAIIANVRRK